MKRTKIKRKSGRDWPIFKKSIEGTLLQLLNRDNNFSAFFCGTKNNQKNKFRYTKKLSKFVLKWIFQILGEKVKRDTEEEEKISLSIRSGSML